MFMIGRINRFNAIFIKIPISFFTKLEQMIFKFIENYKILQTVNPEEIEQNWWYHPLKIQNVLQIHSKQNSMVLEEIKANRSVKQKSKPRNKSTYLYSVNLQQRRQEYTM